MRIVALSVSKPKIIHHKGREVSTGIYKVPVQGPRMVRKTNIDGDVQADLKVHGGPNKAVYAFPFEHYAYYQEKFGQEQFEFGQFGENLTTEGMLESDVRIGDRYRVGEVVFEVSQPRSPCFKFAIKMGSPDAIKACLSSGKTGFYFRVLSEGMIQSGDTIQREFSNDAAPSVEETHRLYYFDKQNIDGLKQAVQCIALAEVWKNEFASRLEKLGVNTK